MQIIPVIDLKGGAVVRGVGGRRDQYQPIVSSLVEGSAADEVSQAFVDRFNARTVYVADLDAIEGRKPNFAAWRAIAASGVHLWLDAGVGSAERAADLRRTLDEMEIAASLVVGLESLTNPEALEALFLAAGGSPIFSLDLRAGQPVARQPLVRQSGNGPESAYQWAHVAVQAGFERLIVLDLADVGRGDGTRTLDLCRVIQERLPQITLVAGGGVRNREDLRDLASAGCSAALVASALHDGRLTSDDWWAAASW
jgi:phosphoribosylformimino-5-aminoimidazole carboxamide ribotide isomerase